MHNRFIQVYGVPFLAFVTVGVAFGVGILVGKDSTPRVDQIIALSNKTLGKPDSVDFSLFWDAWSEIEEKFVATSSSTIPTDEEKVFGAIAGLTASLGDPYTVFLPPKEKELFEDSIQGHFGGVGMEIGMRDGMLTIIAPLKDTPAYRAGILPGDIIVTINDEFSQGMSINDAVDRIRGEIGTDVRIALIREGVEEPIEVTLTRENIIIPTIESVRLPDGSHVIRLFNFSAVSPDLFRDALRDFVKKGGKNLVIDLRGNAGGYLEASVEIASWFLPAGKIIATEDFGDGSEPREHRSKGYDLFDDSIKIVVLVNGGSASASEILAGALKEHDKAVLIGTQTFGKGSVQELIKLSPETFLKLTIARWLTPLGTSISDGGLTPNFVVERTLEDIEAGEDPQEQAAMEYLRTGTVLVVTQPDTLEE